MIGFNGNGRAERPKGYYRDKVKLFFSSGSGLNHNRVSFSILIVAVLFLMAFIIAGFSSLPRYKVDLPYKELSLNVYDFSKPVNDIANFLNNFALIGSTILTSANASSTPTKLFIIEYWSPDYSTEVYLCLYGRYDSDWTQFNSNKFLDDRYSYRLYFVASSSEEAVESWFNVDGSGLNPNFMERNTHYSKFYWIGDNATDYNIFTWPPRWTEWPHREFSLTSLMFLNCYEYNYSMQFDYIRYFE